MVPILLDVLVPSLPSSPTSTAPSVLVERLKVLKAVRVGRLSVYDSFASDHHCLQCRNGCATNRSCRIVSSRELTVIQESKSPSPSASRGTTRTSHDVLETKPYGGGATCMKQSARSLLCTSVSRASPALKHQRCIALSASVPSELCYNARAANERFAVDRALTASRPPRYWVPAHISPDSRSRLFRSHEGAFASFRLFLHCTFGNERSSRKLSEPMS